HPQLAVTLFVLQVAMAAPPPQPFPTVDVPDHAHYTIGSVILAIGVTGVLGNFLVIYAFSRSRSLRTPANMFIINLAVTDLLMCLTQSPVFFTTSINKRWIFGEKGCELYAFCGALFGICSMITLMVIAIDRYFVITRPLTSIGVLSRKRALLILLAVWAYSLGWSLPPFFGWSAYVPEGLLTSCTWDYMTFTPSVRAYTMLLFIFVFFLPLFIIIYCYVPVLFRCFGFGGWCLTDTAEGLTRRSDWLYFRYADMLTPYMNSVPAVIAKASAIHNPIIYAITHPKYRLALAKYVPCLGALLCVRQRDLRSSSSSFQSTRRSTVTSQSSDISSQYRHGAAKARLSSVSDSESGLTDTEADLSSLGSRPASRQVSCDISRDTAEPPGRKQSTSLKAKLRNHDSGIFEKSGDASEGHLMRGQIGRIPSIVVTSETSPFLSISRAGLRTSRPKASSGVLGAGPG
uniref:G-protein coupled receptors family 1 profile domain-containing protein n=1 Tax=Xiphophorus couchianus TaxID=32473 RepID=A0A3B5L3L0_9TELE